jgi:hypothetical protein
MIVFVPFYEIYVIAGGQWLKPIIPATWEAEIGRIKVQGQPGQMVLETPPSPKQPEKNGLEQVAQVVKCLLCKA